MAKRTIHTKEAPAAVGPYSQAVVVGGWLFSAGQVAINPQTGTLVAGGIAEQTAQVFENLSAVLAAADSSLADVVKTTVFLQDMGDFAAMNAVYERYFDAEPPARSTVEVAKLPLGARVEIEVVAHLR